MNSKVAKKRNGKTLSTEAVEPDLRKFTFSSRGFGKIYNSPK